MSRAYKKSLVDTADTLSTGAFNAAGVEQLSGADLEQLRLASISNSNPAVSAAGVKTVGTNLRAALLATVTADAANSVTVDSVAALFVGQVVDIVSNTGTLRADNRTITAIAGLVCTYNGADASASIVAGDYVIQSGGAVSNAALTGADLLRHSGDQ